MGPGQYLTKAYIVSSRPLLNRKTKSFNPDGILTATSPVEYERQRPQ